MKYGAFVFSMLALSISWGHAAANSVENSPAAEPKLEPFTVTGTLKAMELPCMQKHPSGNYFMTSANGSSSGAGVQNSNTSGTGTASGGGGGGGGGGGSGYSVQSGTGPLPEEIRQYQKDLEEFYRHPPQLNTKEIEEGKRPTPPSPPAFPSMPSSQSQSFSLPTKPLTPAEQKKLWISQVQQDIQNWKTQTAMAINEQELIKEYAVKENAAATTDKINELIQLKKAAAAQKTNLLNQKKKYITQNGSLPPSRKVLNNNTTTVVTQRANIQAAKNAYYNGEIQKYNGEIADLKSQLKMGLAELTTLKTLANQENASDTEQFLESIIKGKTEYAKSILNIYKEQIAYFEARREGRPITSGQNSVSFGAGGPQGGTGGGAQGGSSAGGGAGFSR